MLPPFGLAAVLMQWQFAPIVTGCSVIAVGLYCWGVIRVARRHPARPWPAWRTGLFIAGIAVIVLATQSGIGAYDDVLFYDHMVQHLMFLMVAPPLLIAGQPLTLLLHASRNPLHTWAKRFLRSRLANFLTWPVFGAVAYALAVLAAHLSAIANYVDQNQLAHNAEHALFVLIGYLFYLPILGHEPIRWRLSYPVRFVILVLLMPVDTFTGLALGYGSASSPGVPTGPRPAWAPSPVSDLHLGGALMWIGGDGIMFGLMMLVFLMWSRDERSGISGRSWFERARRENLATLVATQQPALAADSAATAGTAPAGSRSTIDDDEHLAAYNAYLARLNEPPPAGTS
jgi:cytochrome c oxidase assembly factor CtaG